MLSLMHILIIHQVFVTPDEGGGTRHYEFAKFLVEMGHRVTVIASPLNYITGKDSGKTFECREGIEIYYVKTFSAINKTILTRMLAFLSFSFNSFFKAMRIKEVDVVWATSPPLFQVMTAWIVSKFKRKPMLFEVRDLWLDFAKELGVVKNRWIIQFFKGMERFLYRKATWIMINSPGFKAHIEPYCKGKPIICVPNGVISADFESADLNREIFRKEHRLEGKFVILYSGNIGIANDIGTIMDSAKLLGKEKDVLFVFVGGGLKIDAYKQQVIREGLQNVIFLGSFPKRKMADVIAAADVCLATLKNIPLFNTTYPNKVFDYMAGRKPTILAIEGVIKTVIQEAQGGICVLPGDAMGLADAVLHYKRNPELIVAHGENARRYVGQHFERKVIAKQLETHLLELIRRAGTPT